MCGITSWHVRMLCDNVMEGGRGYTPREVGEMTLDEVFMLLVDRKTLARRSNSMPALEVQSSFADKDGKIHGVAADGTRIVGRVAGKSKARVLMERKATRLAEEKAAEKSRRRRRRGN